MNPKWIRTGRVASVELASFVAGTVLLACAVGHSPLWTVPAIMLLVTGAIAAGTWASLRSNALEMAWRCPRLAGLGLKVPLGPLPWVTLQAAEAALGVLEGEGKPFREFFPGARLELLQSACRVLDAHRLLNRSARALVDAPEGAARGRLEAQRLRASTELADLTHRLRTLRAQLIASTAPVPSAENPLPALARIEEQSRALEHAVALTCDASFTRRLS